MPREYPGIPRRHPSRPDRDLEPHAPDVYEILKDHAAQLGELREGHDELRGLAHESKVADSKILEQLSEIKATGTHALAKQIIALATAVVVTIGGSIGGYQLTRPSPNPPAVPQRSALDVALDECRPIQDAGSRGQCFTRVFEGQTK